MKSCIYCNYTDTQSSTRDQKKSTNCLQITVNFFHFKSCYCNFHFDLLQLNHCEPYLRARRPTCHILKVPRIKSSHSAALLITTFQWFKQYCSKCNAMAKFTRLMKALPLRLPYEWFDLTATRYYSWFSGYIVCIKQVYEPLENNKSQLFMVDNWSSKYGMLAGPHTENQPFFSPGIILIKKHVNFAKTIWRALQLKSRMWWPSLGWKNVQTANSHSLNSLYTIPQTTFLCVIFFWSCN